MRTWKPSDLFIGTGKTVISCADPDMQAFSLPGNEFSLCEYLNALETSKSDLLEALERIWEAEEPEDYLEGPDSDYNGPALRCRKAYQFAKDVLLRNRTKAPETT